MNLYLVVHLGNMIDVSLFNVGEFEDDNKDIKDIDISTTVIGVRYRLENSVHRCFVNATSCAE